MCAGLIVYLFTDNPGSRVLFIIGKNFRHN